ncbi:hypothetical protein H5410_028141 [Solanum commersonii]|uniref:GAG-pre-integrase domain-containing protein n=1 Tax=Solanum commersonii TaxID=4109 RepID=A0A9J5Z180_SOLCO|nr:hypothetical protein H5410_028141 [Solanum commersonii]
MVHSLSMLTQHSPLDRALCNKVHLPTGSLAHVSHIGFSQVLGGVEISNDLSSGNVRGTDTLENDLYVVHVYTQLKTQEAQLKSQQDQDNTTNVVSSTRSNNLVLWHQRLGHVPHMSHSGFLLFPVLQFIGDNSTSIDIPCAEIPLCDQAFTKAFDFSLKPECSPPVSLPSLAIPTPKSIGLSRSSRPTKPPIWMTDFITPKTRYLNCSITNDL